MCPQLSLIVKVNETAFSRTLFPCQWGALKFVLHPSLIRDFHVTPIAVELDAIQCVSFKTRKLFKVDILAALSAGLNAHCLALLETLVADYCLTSHFTALSGIFNHLCTDLAGEEARKVLCSVLSKQLIQVETIEVDTGYRIFKGKNFHLIHLIFFVLIYEVP